VPREQIPDLAGADIARGIGRAVELLRLRSGLSREDLAARAQPPLSRSTVLKIERRERVPGPETVKRLANGLGVTTDILLVTAWVAAEDDATQRAERAKVGLASGIFGEPSPAVRAGAIAGLGVIAVLGAPVALGAAAALAVGTVAQDHDKKQKEAKAVQRLQVEVNRRILNLTDRGQLEEILNQLPKTGDEEDDAPD
jgi:transcriptional regulator with XRE-family HTH domain